MLTARQTAARSCNPTHRERDAAREQKRSESREHTSDHGRKEQAVDVWRPPRTRCTFRPQEHQWLAADDACGEVQRHAVDRHGTVRRLVVTELVLRALRQDVEVPQRLEVLLLE